MPGEELLDGFLDGGPPDGGFLDGGFGGRFPDDERGEDLVGGARLRTQVALAAVARAAAVPGARPGGGPGARVRWRIGPRAALAAAGVLAALGGAAAWWWWPSGEPSRLVSLDRPAAQAVVPATGTGAGSAAAGTGGGGAGGDGGVAGEDGATTALVVHVVGAVATPGVVRLPAGSRVTDAVTAAGGALPEADLAGVNLARLLTDGEQVVVPAAGETAGAGVGAGTGVSVGPALVDLNTADADALDALPGIGPVLAQRIVTWRTAHGRFTSVDELGEVTGIGPTLLAGVRDLVRV